MDISKKLQNLYEELIEEGCSCNNFYIYGINKNVPDDVVCLNSVGQKWEIYYTERNKKSEIFYSTNDLDDAINYYRTFIKDIVHWHLVCFTRSIEIKNKYKKILEINKIKIVENEIPAYNYSGDHVYRLFITNKDILKAKNLFKDIPYYDDKLKK